jgi:Fe-S cluster assembly protein SufD
MAVVVRKSAGDRDILAELTGERLSGFLSTSLTNDPITAWRQASFRKARELPTPTNRDEDFKYVNFRRLNLGDLTPIEMVNWRNRNGNQTTEIRSGLQSVHEIPGWLRLAEQTAERVDDYFFGSLSDASMRWPERMEHYLSFCDSQFAARKFALLSHAYLSNGTMLYLPAERELLVPRQLYTKLSGEKVMSSYATVAVVEPHSRAELAWDITAERTASGFFNGTLDLIAHAGSKLNVLISQELADSVDSVLTVRVYLEENAEVEIATVNAAGAVVQFDVDLKLAGRGANALVNGIYLARGRENFNFLTHQDHQVGDTRTDLYYAGTLAGRAGASYLGKITIAEDAQRSDAYQTNRNLVLNSGVRVNTSPKLEISANDVRCSHGATTARVSEEEMFYLRSRGLDQTQSKTMLSEGFLQQVTSRIKGESLNQGFSDRLAWLLGAWSENGS